MTKHQFESVYAWQLETFGYVPALPKIYHLEQEVLELQHDLATNSEGKRLEFADCFILLFGAAAADGMSFEDICKAINEKMAINRKRTWSKPDEKGITNHLEDGDTMEIYGKIMGQLEGEKFIEGKTKCKRCDFFEDSETMIYGICVDCLEPSNVKEKEIINEL